MRLLLKLDVILTAACCTPEMARLDQLVLEEAERFSDQIDHVRITSALRPGDRLKHGTGEARDYDAVWKAGVSEENQVAILHAIANRVQLRAGADYDVFAHGPRWHIHGEWDPKREKGVGAGYYERIAATQAPAGGQG